MSSNFDPKNTLGLWEMIMQNADPAEVLRALSASSRSGPASLTATGEHSIVIHSCNVTIHQRITHGPHAETPKGEADVA